MEAQASLPSFGDDYKRRFLAFVLAREQAKSEALEQARADARARDPSAAHLPRRSMFYGEMVGLFQPSHPLAAIKSVLLQLDFPLSKSLFSPEEIEAISQALDKDKERRTAVKPPPVQPVVGEDLAKAKSPAPLPVVGEKLNMLSDEIFRAMCRVFKQTDRLHTGVVSSLDFLRNLRTSDQTRQFLGCPALFYARFQKTVTLAKFLDYFEFRVMYAEENLGVRPLVSWADFVEHFGSFRPLDVFERDSTRREIEHRFTIVLADELKDAIAGVFRELKNEENLVRRDDFLAALLRHPLVAASLDTVFKRYRRMGVGGPEPPAVDVKAGFRNVARFGDNWLDLREFFDLFLYFEGAETLGQVLREEGKEGGFVRITHRLDRPLTFVETNEQQLQSAVDYHTRGWNGLKDPLAPLMPGGTPPADSDIDRAIHEAMEAQKALKDTSGLPKKVITVPEPFAKMGTQSSLPKDNISRKRFQEYLKEKENRERGELTGKPRVNPAPSRSPEKRVVVEPPKLIPTREQQVGGFVERTKTTEEPFSFTDVHFKSKRPPPVPPATDPVSKKAFSAKEVPWFCAPEVLREKHQAAEKQREQRIRERAASVG